MKLVKAAYILAFVIAGISIVVALAGPIVVLPLAAIPLLAGIGIVRRRVWSAYGLALYEFAQLLLLPILLSRSGNRPGVLPGAIVSAVVGVALAALFLSAGRALQAAGCKRGSAAPWIAVSLLCTVPLIFVDTFAMPSASMEDTLLIGDRFFVQRWPRPQPVRGEIVAFVYPMDRNEDYVKRIIGVPGDRIRIANKAVYRNGALLQESYAVHKFGSMDPYRDNFPSDPAAGVLTGGLDMLKNHVVQGEVIVPADRCFVLGDNRDDSFDSRYWGFIATDDVIGKPLLIYDSQEESPEDALSGKSTGLHRRMRWNRIFRIL